MTSQLRCQWIGSDVDLPMPGVPAEASTGMMAHMSESSGRGVRIDVWLYSVRAYRTRTAATEACRSGKVKIAGEPAKAAQRVASGDLVEFKRVGDAYVFEVVETISKRVGAERAAECRIDHTPPRPKGGDEGFTPPAAERERGAGRPTKRDRRRIETFTKKR